MKHTIHNHYYNNQSQPENLKAFAPVNYLRILNKSAGKIHKIQIPEKIYKNIGAYKNLGGYKNMGASKNFGGC